MSNNNSILIIQASDLKRAADRIFMRIERTERTGRKVTQNGILADIAGCITDENLNWGGILARSIVCHNNIKLKNVLEAIAGPKLTDGGGADPVEQPAVPVFELFASEEILAKERMLELASLWRKGGYAGHADQVVVCRFGERDIYEFELVCLADLFTSSMTGVALKYHDSGYRLLREWIDPEQMGQNATEPKSLQMMNLPKIIFSLAQGHPLSRESQVELLMQMWAYLKDFSTPESEYELHHQLLMHLGWWEEPSG